MIYLFEFSSRKITIRFMGVTVKIMFIHKTINATHIQPSIEANNVQIGDVVVIYISIQGF
jgi:hypothetical protein